MGVWGITLFSVSVLSVNIAFVAALVCLALLRFGVSHKTPLAARTVIIARFVEFE